VICRQITSKLKIVVRVASYFSLPDGGPKRYCNMGKLPPWFVEMGNYSLLQLVDDIAKHSIWGSKQYITIWRECSDDEACVEIKSDENLLNWFQLNIEKGEVGIYAEIKDFEGPLQSSLTKRRCHPMVRNTLSTTLDLPIEPTSWEDTDESLTHKNATMKAKKRKSKRKGAHDEDPVGVDEESFYSYRIT
jgi:hypothetical protein